MFQLILSMTLFLAPTDTRLNEESLEVCPCEIRCDEVQEIIDTMLDIAHGETRDRTRSVMVGLAAPQIGIQERIILVDIAATGIFTKELDPPPSPDIRVFINPKILWQSEEKEVWREGCYSTGRICGLVPRSKKVLIRAYDRDGNIITEEFSGYVARIFQHEIDHLDGIRFPDRIDDDSALHWVDEEDLIEYRIDWNNWPKKISRADWEKVRDGNSR